ncbi:MAG: hypothetical protein ACRENE_15060, partial [Polyangiaceae bacterium]
MATVATIPAARKRSERTLVRAQQWPERLAEAAVKVVSLASIAAVILILVFVGKEALPVFLSPELRHEVSPLSLVVPQTSAGFAW